MSHRSLHGWDVAADTSDRMGKRRLRLIPWAAIPWVARALEQGATKHGDDGDRPGYLDRDPDEYAEKALRHLVAHMAGRQAGDPMPINHEDGDLPHLVHAAADGLIAVGLWAIRREER